MYGVRDLKHEFSAYSQASNFNLVVYDFLLWVAADISLIAVALAIGYNDVTNGVIGYHQVAPRRDPACIGDPASIWDPAYLPDNLPDEASPEDCSASGVKQTWTVQ